jgi:hypothetical protein
MTTNECKTIRRELDEADPIQQLSNSAAEHLRGCSDCNAFASDQRALRGLIATLQPVVAPADFDFRLRARLAREKSGAQNGAGIRNFFKMPLPAAVAVLVLLVGVAGVVIRNWVTSSSANLPASKVVAVTPNNAVPAVPSDRGTESTKAVATTGAGNPRASDSHSVSAPGNRPPRVNQVVVRRPEVGVRDFGVSPASVLMGEQADLTGAVVRVPLDARALQISIDDGRGETRTISLPRVSFGSQRLVASQGFMPAVSPTKGVW